MNRRELIKAGSIFIFAPVFGRWFKPIKKIYPGKVFWLASPDEKSALLAITETQWSFHDLRIEIIDNFHKVYAEPLTEGFMYLNEIPNPVHVHTSQGHRISST